MTSNLHQNSTFEENLIDYYLLLKFRIVSKSFNFFLLIKNYSR